MRAVNQAYDDVAALSAFTSQRFSSVSSRLTSSAVGVLSARGSRARASLSAYNSYENSSTRPSLFAEASPRRSNRSAVELGLRPAEFVRPAEVRARPSDVAISVDGADMSPSINSSLASPTLGSSVSVADANTEQNDLKSSDSPMGSGSVRSINIGASLSAAYKPAASNGSSGSVAGRCGGEKGGSASGSVEGENFVSATRSEGSICISEPSIGRKAALAAAAAAAAAATAAAARGAPPCSCTTSSTSSAHAPAGCAATTSTQQSASTSAARHSRRVSFSERVSSRFVASPTATSNARLLRLYTAQQEARAKLELPRSWLEGVPVPTTPLASASAPKLLYPVQEAAHADAHAPKQRPGDALRRMLHGTEQPREAQQARLHAAAARIRDPDYNLHAFYDDMIACFPELRLYVPLGESGSEANSFGEELSKPQSRTTGGGTSSGRSSTEEYQRTLGAFFAFFWLMRLNLPSTVAGSEHLDGQRGFCFGVAPDTWEPPSAEAVARLIVAGGQETRKRGEFMETMDWKKLHELMVDAGLLEVVTDGGSSRGGHACQGSQSGHVGAGGSGSANGFLSGRSFSWALGSVNECGSSRAGAGSGAFAVRVVVPRVAAMLTLTAIHDVFKLTPLLPTVMPEHAPYHGHEAGALLVDHDMALGYVLEHDPTALPCFANLPETQQASIKFTQAELGFNHGWLVQAEAPPGALFLRLKAAIRSANSAKADIAFYFAHWFTDLAGAQPTPLRGSEKLVVMFPTSVLLRLVRSMGIVQDLVNRQPTELFEEFLEAEWRNSGRKLSELPSGPAAIALMRLVVQVQDPAAIEAVVSAFTSLPSSLRDALSRELACTGVAGECYKRCPAVTAGPAFLVYYSPAFLRHCCACNLNEAQAALWTLAEVYRAARVLWPARNEPEWQEHEVVVHIDELKDCFSTDLVDAYANGECWLVVRVSNHTAVVVRQPLEQVLAGTVRHCQLCVPPSSCEVLRLWPAAMAAPARASAHPKGKQLLQSLIRKHSETLIANCQ
uniref:Uncharacterized protein n=2 Tax=Chrysotila carterae TaxID=13221 RepID=A0A7S4BGT0_CHRCT